MRRVGAWSGRLRRSRSREASWGRSWPAPRLCKVAATAGTTAGSGSATTRPVATSSSRRRWPFCCNCSNALGHVASRLDGSTAPAPAVSRSKEVTEAQKRKKAAAGGLSWANVVCTASTKTAGGSGWATRGGASRLGIGAPRASMQASIHRSSQRGEAAHHQVSQATASSGSEGGASQPPAGRAPRRAHRLATSATVSGSSQMRSRSRSRPSSAPARAAARGPGRRVNTMRDPVGSQRCHQDNTRSRAWPSSRWASSTSTVTGRSGMEPASLREARLSCWPAPWPRRPSTR